MGSLFDGISGFPHSAQKFGIKTLWASEIEPSCISISKRHFPDMAHLGDITKINGGEVEPVDIITFGSPCQDLSLAGKKAGMKHEDLGSDETTRSGLFMEAIRIIGEMREATDGRHPTFAIWENVPGAFSSNDGLDFMAVLKSFCGAEVPMPGSGRWACAGMVRGGRCDIAWRVLDAQYWGVAQRRRRIFLVADFGGQRAAKILFERDGLRRDTAPRGGAREEAAADAGSGFAGADGMVAIPVNMQIATRHNEHGRTTGLGVGEEGDAAYTLQEAHHHAVIVCEREGEPGGGKGPPISNGESLTHSTSNNQALFCMATQQGGAEIGRDLCPTITEAAGKSGNNQPVVFDARGCGGGAVAPTIAGDHAGHISDYTPIVVTFEPGLEGGKGGHYYENVCGTLRASPGDNRMSLVAPFDTTQITSKENRSRVENGAPCHTLNKNAHPPAIVAAFAIEGNGARPSHRGSGISEDISFTLNTTERHAVAYSFDSLASNSMKSSNPSSGCREVDVSSTLTTFVPDPAMNHGGIAVVAPNVAKCLKAKGNLSNREDSDTLVCVAHGQAGAEITEDLCPTLNCNHEQPYVVAGVDCRNGVENADLSATLQAKTGGGHSLNYTNPVRAGPVVRRLMPVECERLMWLPDGWTALGDDGKPVSDSKRYAAIGNSVAIPCVDYIMQGVAEFGDCGVSQNGVGI